MAKLKAEPPRPEFRPTLKSESPEFVVQCKRLWKAVETERKRLDLSPKEAAERSGFKRATWYNKRKDPRGVTLAEAANIADLLGLTYRVPLTRSAVSGSRDTLVETSTGGLHLTDLAQRILLILRRVPEEHHQFILDAVKDAAELKGFQSPGAAGAADARQGKNSK